MRIKEDDNNIKIVHFLGHTPLSKLFRYPPRKLSTRTSRGLINKTGAYQCRVLRGVWAFRRDRGSCFLNWLAWLIWRLACLVCRAAKKDDRHTHIHHVGVGDPGRI